MRVNRKSMQVRLKWEESKMKIKSDNKTNMCKGCALSHAIF